MEWHGVMRVFNLWGQYLPGFLQGLVVTLELTAAALLLALVLGFLLALARLTPIRVFRIVSGVYIEVIRAIPVLVLIFMVYYGLPELGIKLSAFVSAVVALGAFYATLYGEIFRGGILGVGSGQSEAAVALGMSRSAVMRKIILPQAFMTILPPATNQLSNLIKDTSLVVTIGVADLMFQTYTSMAQTFQDLDMLVLAAIMYFAFYIVLSRILARWELSVQRSRR